MRPVAVLLLALPATSCHAPSSGNAPPGPASVLFTVELFESDAPAPDLSDPRQATSLGRQEISSSDTEVAVYEARASLVQVLPDQNLRAAHPVEAEARRGGGTVLPAGYQNSWRLRLELRPERTDGLWRARGQFQLILANGHVAVELPVELEPVPEQAWRLDLGRSKSSGGYLSALVEIRP
ncbi:MAG: hypothetical protein ISR76_05165 [Planctomycetes bacterium]|nr:hypothetical protein [Planctomycetota bacterium]MBL7008367.1 hypothetical protein [Planctomycetota bacterium]